MIVFIFAFQIKKKWLRICKYLALSQTASREGIQIWFALNSKSMLYAFSMWLSNTADLLLESVSCIHQYNPETASEG